MRCSNLTINLKAYAVEPCNTKRNMYGAKLFRHSLFVDLFGCFSKYNFMSFNKESRMYSLVFKNRGMLVWMYSTECTSFSVWLNISFHFLSYRAKLGFLTVWPSGGRDMPCYYYKDLQVLLLRGVRKRSQYLHYVFLTHCARLARDPVGKLTSSRTRY